MLGLVGCATPTQLAASAKDDSRAVRLAAVLALRRLKSSTIAEFLTDPDPLIIREAALAINDEPIPTALPALAALTGKPVANEATMLRALNAHFRLGTSADATALANYAVRPEAPAQLRAEALTLLTLWSQPPARDRLVGIYRPLAEKNRPTTAVIAALEPHLARLLTGASPESVKSATITALVKLKLASASANLLTLVANSAEPLEWICIDAGAITDVDFTGSLTIKQVQTQLAEHDIKLVVADAMTSVKEKLDRYGITALIGEDAYFPTVESSVQVFTSKRATTESDPKD